MSKKKSIEPATAGKPEKAPKSSKKRVEAKSAIAGVEAAATAKPAIAAKPAATSAKTTGVVTKAKTTLGSVAAKPSLEPKAAIAAAGEERAKPKVNGPVRLQPSPITHEEIARLAYSYAEARGFQGGSPEDDWKRAERELRGIRGLS